LRDGTTTGRSTPFCRTLAALDAWQDRRGRRFPPSLRTFRRVLRVLDGGAAAAAFGIWLKGQVVSGLADAAALLIALDGKTVRGARTGDEKAPHLSLAPEHAAAKS
jgi:hypothetical protein